MKIGILTHQYINNYGAFLQAWALRKAISELFPEDEVQIIDYVNVKHYIINAGGWFRFYKKRETLKEWFAKVQLPNTFAKARNQEMVLSKRCFNARQINELEFDCIVVGSDEVWNYRDTKGNAELKFGVGLTCKNLIAYSLNTVSRNVLMVSTVRMGIIRAEATFGHPVYYAMYCALIIPLALYMWQNERRMRNGCILGLNIVAAFLTESRGTIVVLLALLLVFILITDKKTRNKILCAGCVIACLVFLISVTVPTVSQQFTNIIKSVIIAFGDSGETIENFGGNSSTGLSSRMIQLSGITWMLMHNAIFGLGASCHTRGKLSYRISGIWQVRDTIDNGYVGYFVEEGLLGGIACFSLFYSLLKSSWKKATFKNSRNMNNSFFLCFVSYVAVMLSVADVSQLLWVIIALYIIYNAKAQAIVSE